MDETLTAEPGVAGDVVAYLGDYEAHTATGSGQQFHLVVPESAGLAESPDAILEALVSAADAIRIGDRDDDVLAVAAPTGAVEWGVRGLQTGPADLWVRDHERLADPENVWLHEYVHTRQDWTTAPDASWVTEATATYYAALLSLEADRIDYGAARERLRRGESSIFDGAVLSDPSTWRNEPNYHLGALAVGDLDRRIRLATGGEGSLQDVLRRLNDDTGEVDAAAVRAAVRAVGGDRLGGLAGSYADGTRRPSTWSQAEHEVAFGSLPARIGYRLRETDPVRVTGPYRNRSLGRTPTLVPGERIHVDVTVENAGGTTGDYEATLRLDDATLDAVAGRLSPGESAVVALSGATDATGSFDLRAGDARLPVEVREPAEATVVSLSPVRSRVAPGESVAVDVTLRNDASWPAEREVAVVADGTVVDASTVRLDAGERRSVRRTIDLDRTGRYELRIRGAEAAGASVVVRDRGSPYGTVVGVVLIVSILLSAAAVRRAAR